MGSFSWTKADGLTKVANILEGKPFKFLIPKEFGGGFIKDCYQGYGDLGIKRDGSSKYDMYELLAFWNADAKVPFGDGETIRSVLKYDGTFPLLKEIDQYTDENRSLGIDIGCLDGQIDKLKYPLKLVSASYNGTYEDCEGRSYSDPNQGYTPLYRDKNKKGMTREEFNNAILEEFTSYQNKELKKSATQLFDDSYTIAKTTAIKDYLTESDDESIENLYAYEEEHSTLLYDLCDYEYNYDMPMWGDWESLSLLVHDFVSEIVQTQ